MNNHKWYSFLVAGLILMLLPITVAACGTQSRVPGVGGGSTLPGVSSEVAKNYADFEVGPIIVTRNGVSVDETANVSATVTNSGGVGGVYKAVLLVDGKEVNKKDVSIGPKGSDIVVFQVTKASAGSYKLEIGKSAAVLNVYGWPYKIQYDAGSAYGNSLSVAGDYGHMVHFTPPTVPFKVQKIDFYANALVPKDSDWTDKQITLRIWDSSNKQLWAIDVPWRTVWDETTSLWKQIDVPNVSVDGDFYVEVVTHSGQFSDDIVAPASGPSISPAVFVGIDNPTPYIDEAVSSRETRSGVSSMGKYVDVQIKYQGFNWLVRVEGDGSL